MAKITITDLATLTGAVNDINNKFQQIEDELNNKVLYRNAPVGEDNSLQHDIDLNNQDLLNVKNVNAASFSIGGKELSDIAFQGNYYVGTPQPSELSDGDLWYDTVANKLGYYNGTEVLNFIDILTDLKTLYLGSYHSNLSTDFQGNPVQNGAIYFNTTENELRIYEDGTWYGFLNNINPTFTTDTTVERGNKLIFGHNEGTDKFWITRGDAGSYYYNEIYTAPSESLRIDSDSVYFYNSERTDKYAEFTSAGCKFYHSSTTIPEFQTTPDGIDIFGSLNMGDGYYARFGDAYGGDMVIGHHQPTSDPGYNFITSDSKELRITCTDEDIKVQADGSGMLFYYDTAVAFKKGNGPNGLLGPTVLYAGSYVRLYYTVNDLSSYQRLSTTESGMSMYGDINLLAGESASGSTGQITTSGDIICGGEFFVEDENKIALGNTRDLEIYHTSVGNNPLNYITADQSLFIESGDDLNLKGVNGVNLYHSGTMLLQTYPNIVRMMKTLEVAETSKFENDATFEADVIIEGDLTVTGNTTTVSASNLSITDNIIYLNGDVKNDIVDVVVVGGGTFTLNLSMDHGLSAGDAIELYDMVPTSWNGEYTVASVIDSDSINITTSNTDTITSNGYVEYHSHTNVDLGWVGAYDDGTYAHAGLFRDASDGAFRVFDGYTPETASGVDIDTTHASFNLAAFDVGELQLNGTAVTATADELNTLDGITSSVNELNILDGVTATATELNYNDITQLGEVEASKVVTANANEEVIFGVRNASSQSHKLVFKNASGTIGEIYQTGSNGLFVANDADKIVITAQDSTNGSITLSGSKATDTIELKNGANTLATFDTTSIDFNYPVIISSTLDVDGINSSDDIELADNKQISFGGTSYLLGINASTSTNKAYITANTNVPLEIYADDLQLKNSTGYAYLTADDTSGAVRLYFDKQNYSAHKLATTATGVSISGSLSVSQDVLIPDNYNLKIGTSADLQLYHNSAHSFIDSATNTLFVRAANRIELRNANGTETYASFIENDAASLFYDNSLKLSTTSTGVDVLGGITTQGLTTSADINFGDDNKAVFGASNDLEIYHYLGNSYIWNNNGPLWIGESVNGGDIFFYAKTSGGTGFYPIKVTGASSDISLTHAGSEKLKVVSTGIDVTGTVTADDITATGAVSAGSLSCDENVTLGSWDTWGNIGLGTDLYTATSTSSDTNNIAIGHSALYSQTTGSNNVAIGTGAGYFNTSVGYSIAIGYQAAYGSSGYTGGPESVSIGYRAGYYGSGNNGNQNIYIGRYAGYGKTTSNGANYNVGIGSLSLYDITSGDYNTAVGSESLTNVTSGIHNTGLGYRANYSTTTASYCTAVGAYANYSSNANYNTCIGAYTNYGVSGIDQVVCVGYYAGHQAYDFSTDIGYYAGGYGRSNYTVNVGYEAGRSSASYTSANYNVNVGYRTHYNVQASDYSVAIGSHAFGNALNAQRSVAVGYYAGYGHDSYDSVYIGAYAGYDSDAQYNIAIGRNAGYHLDGIGNVAIGYSALNENSVTGDYNIGIGYGSELSATTANNECQIGAPSGDLGEITRLDVGGCNFSMTNTSLYHGAEIRAGGDVVAFYSSDINLKENIQNIPDALAKVNSIRGVTYDWKDDYLESKGKQDDYFNRKHDVGVIAQEVEAVLPEVVAERKDGTKAVRYEKLTALLIEAVNDLTTELKTVKKELEELKNGIS
jgi:hypothetical protein